MSLPLVSICIPTYELGGRGITMLSHLLRSIELQLDTFREFEIVVSDHSRNNNLYQLCQQFETLPIRYFMNPNHRGSCEANLNNAIRLSRGKFIKPLLQDDFFITPNALARMVGEIQSDQDWVATACLHCREDNVRDLFYPHLARWVPDRSLALGQNRVGSPSVILYPSKVQNRYFDEHLVWLMDCEMYYRLGEEIGIPKLVTDYLVCIRFRHDSLSDSGEINDDLKGEQYHYVIDKMDNTERPLTDFPLMYERAQKLGLKI